MRLVLLALLTFATMSAMAEAEAATSLTSQCGKDALIGNWKLILAEDFIDGKWVRFFGDEPQGYFSFSPDGWASVQFMKFPLDKSAPGEKSYLAYFGRYSVDQKACTFTVAIEGALNQNLVGTKAERPFKLEGSETLYVGDGISFRRTFVRMRFSPELPTQQGQEGAPL